MRTTRSILCGLAALAVHCAVPLAAAADDLRFGYAEQVITPPVGAPTFNSQVKATGKWDDLWTRALVLSSGKSTVLFSTSDILGVDEKAVARIRKDVSAKTGIAEGAILPVANHTHPSLWYGNPEPYYSDIIQAIAETAIRAAGALRPCRVAAATACCEEVGVRGSPEVKWLAVDGSIPVLRIDDLEGKTRLLVTSYGAHPVCLHPSDKWSADYPGRVVASLEGRSAGMQAMFLGGVLGAFNPAAGRTYENTTSIGRRIADAAWTAALSLRPVQAQENVLRIAVRRQVAIGPGGDVPAKEFLRLLCEHLRNETVLWQALGRSPPHVKEGLAEHVQRIAGRIAEFEGKLAGDLPTWAAFADDICAVRLNDVLWVTSVHENFSGYNQAIRELARKYGYATVFCTAKACGLGSYVPDVRALDGDQLWPTYEAQIINHRRGFGDLPRLWAIQDMLAKELGPAVPGRGPGWISGKVTLGGKPALASVAALQGEAIADYAVAGISGAPANFTPKFQLDGDFRLTLPPGTYEVVVARSGSPLKRFPAVKVTAGATATVDVRLAEGERK
jgi:hypothetical protein